MSLSAGTRLGPYELVALLGAGGMGEVYRARDTRLGREVAIKVLPPAFANDADRRARFEREAKAVAALSHPNIVALFDTGLHEESLFLVTELLEGETLRDRLTSVGGSGPSLPVRKVVEIGVQIARGLAAAHAKGLIHRDLKPENVFLLADGQVKILDFGLAREISSGSGATETVAALTDPGVVMGTAGYMAPEQVRGQPADARTDLFALGAILYEMLSGQRAFRRDTSAETMTAILKEAPPELGVARADLAPALVRIVEHCLEKNPVERFQSARDIAFALEALSGSTASGPSALTARGGSPQPDVVAPISRRVLRTVALGATLIAVLAGGVAVGRRFAPRPVVPSATFVPKTFDRQTISRARFLPDGRTIVHDTFRQAGDPDVVVIRPDRDDSELLVAHAALLSVSSKGELAVLTQLVFPSFDFTGTLARMTPGAAPRPLLDQVRSADWSPDGNAFAVVHIVGGRDRLEYPIGTTLFETGGVLSDVRVSPDGSLVAVVDHADQDDAGWVRIVDRSSRVTTLAGRFSSVYGLAWTPDGSTVLFSANEAGVASSGDQIHAVAAAAGSPVRTLQQSPGGLRVMDVAASGTMLVARNDLRTGVVAQVPGAARERDLSWLNSSMYPFLSADGTWIVFTDFRAGTALANASVWLRRTDGSPAEQLGPGYGFGFSPDGRSVLAATPRPPRLVLYPTGAGTPVTLAAGPIETYTSVNWFPDGRRLLVCGNEPSRPRRCYEQDLIGGAPRAISPEGVVGLYISPDGRRLLAQDAAQAWQVVPLDGAPMHPAAGLHPSDNVGGWSSDGRAAFASLPNTVPTRLERVDLATGVRTFLKEIAPSDRSGVNAILVWNVIDDGRGYAYSYVRWNSTIYVAEGLSTSP